MTYPAQLTNPPQTNAAVVVNENGKAIRHVAVYANDYMTTSGLARGYIGGRWGGFAVADATHTFGASTTTYVSVVRADGSLNFSTSGTNYNDSTNYAKVETVVTDASSVTSVTDDRAGPGGAHGSRGGAAGITALTGDVTASGTGSVAATIANGAVAYAKIQNVSSASRLLGRGSAGGAGGIDEMTAGGGLSILATVLQGAHVINAQTGTTYAIVATDRGAHVTLSNASSIAVSIAQAGTTGFENGYYTYLENIGAGAVTLTPTTSTVNGNATLVLTSGMSCVLFSDGTNYRAFVFEAPGMSVNAQTGTTYTYLSGDRRKLVTHTNASAIAGTLPQATGAFGNGWFAWVQNRGAGTLTITPTTSTIDGSATLALTTGQGTLIASDGTNYYTMRGVGGGGGITALTGDITASGTGSVAATLANSGVTAGTYTSTNLTVDAKGRITAASNGSGGGSTQGLHDAWIGAGSWYATIAAPPTAWSDVQGATDQPDWKAWSFDPSTVNRVWAVVSMPKSYNGGTITFDVHWRHPSTTTNFDTVWGMRALFLRNGDALATNYGTAQTVTDTGGSTNTVYLSPTSSAITPAGTYSAHCLLFIELYRDAANGADTLAVGASLLGATIHFTTNADTDA